MVKKKTAAKTNSKSKRRKAGEAAGAIVTVMIFCFLAVYKILPEIKSVLLTDDTRKQKIQESSDNKSNLDSEKHFDV